MPRGSFEPPNLDDRNWQDIVNEAKALIPKYASDWTDHNPSDLGITLIELFAWMVEGMIYRLNRVPEKNYLEFLNLLGITQEPAKPASTVLTFETDKACILEKGCQFSTEQKESEEAVIFETDEKIGILPIHLTEILYIENINNFEKPEKISVPWINEEEIEIKINNEKQSMIVFGFKFKEEEIIDGKISFLCNFIKPAKINYPEVKNNIQITWRYPEQDNQELINWPEIIYSELDFKDGTNSFNKNGLVCFNVPKSWTAVEHKTLHEEKLLHIGILFKTDSKNDVSLKLNYIFFNSVSATNALTINEEVLGISNGKPFQFFELKNRPLYKQPGISDPYEHLVVEIHQPKKGKGSFAKPELWTKLDDFPNGTGKFYRVNSVTGTIYFGNYDPETKKGNGEIPLEGSEICAKSYRYVVGGARGNVPKETITHPINIKTIPKTLIPKSVINLLDAQGGEDVQNMEDAKRSATDILRNRTRAVTVEDYEFLAREASEEVKKVRCIQKELKEDEAGYIKVFVMQDAPPDELEPKVSEELLQKVQVYLDDRRLLTTKLVVVPPKYVKIKIIAEFNIWKKSVKKKDFEEEINKEIIKFLHPIYGGINGKGYDIGQDFLISDLFKKIIPAPEIGYIKSLKIDQNKLPDRQNKSEVWVNINDDEILCSFEFHQVIATPIDLPT